MKTLELNEMEQLNGGNLCELGLGVSGSAALLEGVALYTAIASGPIGWAFLGLAVVGFAITAASCAKE